MNLFVFIANAWGPISGGINSFNYDLTVACARFKKNNKSIKICCVIPDLTENEKKMIKTEGIIPITLSKEAFGSLEATHLISENLEQQSKLRHYYPRHCNTFCIGQCIVLGKLNQFPIFLICFV